MMPSAKTICVDVRMALHSGIGTYIRNILPFLKDHFTSLYVLASTSLVEKWPELKSYDVIPITASLYSIQEQLELPLRIPSCSLYWSPHYNIPLLPIRAKTRVVTIHDVYHLVYGNTLSIPKRFYAKSMIKSATLFSDHIVTISRFSLDEIVKYTHVSPDKISMIHNGVNMGLFAYPVSHSAVNRVRLLYHLPQKYFLFVSTLAPHKNLTRLLRAWNQVIHKHPDWHLVLVGKQVKNVDYLNVFDEFPRLKSRVQFIGQVGNEDLPALYQAAHALISPSLYEGFGLTPLEAMAMRCPSIVSQGTSFAEVCGDAARYVNPFDIDDIARKICELIESPTICRNFIEKGRERVQQFNWAKTAQAHIRLFEQV